MLKYPIENITKLYKIYLIISLKLIQLKQYMILEKNTQLRKKLFTTLIGVLVLTGCMEPFSAVVEVRPGVYVTNDTNALQLPTSGYDIYVVGEWHGQHEVHLLFFDYMKDLHEAGLRDIILEGDQVWEREANNFALGINDTLDMPYEYLKEFLSVIRTFNESLSDNEKINVHLVDVDLSLSAIVTHLHILREEIGEPADTIEIPALKEFETWWEDRMLALVDQFAEIAEDSMTNELKTLKASIHYYFSIKGRGLSRIRYREEAIVQNIRDVLHELKGTSALALYGIGHSPKVTNQPPEYHPWAQRLAESGISIYSVAVTGVSGQSGFSWQPDKVFEVDMDPSELSFADGTTLADIFNNNPDYIILYVDLREDANTIRYSGGDSGSFNIFDQDIPIKEMFDGIMLFREVSPLQLKESSGFSI
jgi:hypothetical protein